MNSKQPQQQHAIHTRAPYPGQRMPHTAIRTPPHAHARTHTHTHTHTLSLRNVFLVLFNTRTHTFINPTSPPHAQVYKQEATPVEDFFRAQGLLVDFEITAGIPETLPLLMPLLQSYAGAGRRAD